MGVGRAGGQEHRVGVPVDRGDGAADGLLQVLRDPPVVLLLEVADGDDAVAGADGELGLGGRPADKGGGPGDAEEDEGRLVSGGRRLPDKGVSVLRACDDAATGRGDVDAGDGLIMAVQLIL